MTDAPVSPIAQRQRVRAMLAALGMLPVLILLAVGFQLLSGRFMNPNNLSIVMQALPELP